MGLPFMRRFHALAVVHSFSDAFHAAVSCALRCQCNALYTPCFTGVTQLEAWFHGASGVKPSIMPFCSLRAASLTHKMVHDVPHRRHPAGRIVPRRQRCGAAGDAIAPRPVRIPG